MHLFDRKGQVVYEGDRVIYFNVYDKPTGTVHFDRGKRWWYFLSDTKQQAGVIPTYLSMHHEYGIEKIEDGKRVFEYGLPVRYSYRNRRQSEIERILRETVKRLKQ